MSEIVTTRRAQLIEGVKRDILRLENLFRERKERLAKVNKSAQWELAKMYENDIRQIVSDMKTLFMVLGAIEAGAVEPSIIEAVAEEAKSVSPLLAFELLMVTDM